MRLGLLGGTFDPPHFGHLLAADQCREQCQLDQVWLIPAGTPPHKLARAITPGSARADMLELAVAGNDSLRVHRLELHRSGPSYTVDTLQQLRDEDPARDLFFIIGADSLIDFPTWREPRRIAELATLVVVNRGGTPLPPLDSLRPALGDPAIDCLQVVTIPAVDFASRDLRQRLRTGRSIRYMTPRAVECYIQTHDLYRDQPDSPNP